jgi:hypothetical protein
MESLIKFFDNIEAKLKILTEDVAKKIDTLKTQKEHTTKTIMPLTKIYKSEKEVKEASESPEIAFIKNGIENAFKE